MKNFIRKEGRLFFKALSAIFILWIILCFWNGIWGYKKDSARDKIVTIYTAAEASKLAFADEQANDPSNAGNLQTGTDNANMADSSQPLQSKELLFDSSDINEIYMLNKTVESSRSLMIGPNPLFKIILCFTLAIFIVLYPVRILLFLLGVIKSRDPELSPGSSGPVHKKKPWPH